MSTQAATVVSAPGKVLLAGGYLVLDPVYPGVVVSTSSRFFTLIKNADPPQPGQITVQSPQFVDASWTYDVDLSNELHFSASSENKTKNKFVHLALERTLLLAVEATSATNVKDILASGLSIQIMGDNDFYSQRAQLAALDLPLALDSLSRLPRFAQTNVSLSDVHKTGLGSSASLITSLVCALLIHFNVIPSSSLSEDHSVHYSEGRHLAHNVAQYIHCLAQGKVGSGFDVSSATFGSQLYSRFDPKVIETLMVDELPTERLLPILSPSNKSWNHRVSPFQLPPLTRLMLADVDAGSDTPSLVGQVLKWRKQNSNQALALWTDLAESNEGFSTALKELTNLHKELPDAYASAVATLSKIPHTEWTGLNLTPPETQVVESFLRVYQLTEDIRSKMREMGSLCGVPIEPKEQTSLLNACISEPGVVGGGVPGAGGYDALWLLVFDDGSKRQDLEAGTRRPIDRVQQVWQNWTELSVCPLSAVESMEKGARLESIASLSNF